MSAVAGLYRLDGRLVAQEHVQVMVDAMAHRGQDGTGVWDEGAIGLAHRMFHTTPESLGETLPLHDSGIAITADARIDNREELIGSLGLGAEAGGIADSVLILRAYAEWGERCLDHLVGDFAFAIWDSRAQRLFCARDHFGVRPLYYHHQPGVLFAFGTEIKALLTVPGIPERLNEVRIADYLASMREDAESTIYEDIWSLPAAHALVVDDAGLRVWRYYELAPAEGVPQDAPDEWYDERFRELFTEAVRCRVRSAFEVGSQLSGGLDSSSVTCVARDLMEPEGQELHTFSLVFNETPECDERPYINAVLAQGGFVPHFISGDTVGPLSNLDELYALLDDGLVGGNQHLVWALLKAAREAGVRVVLDGVDGDNVVSHGQLYLKELIEAGDWAGFHREVQSMAERYGQADHLHDFEHGLASPMKLFNAYAAPYLKERAERGPWWRFIKDARAASRYFPVTQGHLVRFYWGRLVRPYSLLRVHRAWRARRARRPGEHPPLPELVDPGFASRIGLAERLARFPSPEKTGQFRDSVRETQRVLLGSARLGYALTMTNHVGAICSVEVRHPFMDKRLVEYCLALPAEQSMKNGWARLILRRALSHTLPEEVAWRVGKAWMTPSFERGLFEVDGELLQEHIIDLGPLGAYANRSHVGDMFAGGRELTDEAKVNLARVATLSFWLKKRFAGEGVSVEPVESGNTNRG